MQRSSDETILYLISNRELGWRKIGIGFGSRLEKWRRDGWVLEQQVLFDSREDASFAEGVLMRKLSSHDFLRRRDHPGEGHTEMWPYEYGPIDLARVKVAVDNFNAAMKSVWPFDFHAYALCDAIDEWMEATAAADIPNDDPKVLDVAQRLESLLGLMAQSAEKSFIRDREHDWTREDLERYGLDWNEMVRRRQDYWASRRASDPDSETGNTEGWAVSE